MDPLETALAVFNSAMAVKVFGPIAEDIGIWLRDKTKMAIENVTGIVNIATRRLGDRIEEPGAVPPKVLARVIQEGAFCDDPLTAEYFGGVLASSRSGVPRDDRGAALMSLIGRLSTYQIRTHYIFYTLIREAFKGTDLHIQQAADRLKMMVFVPHASYLPAMAMSPDEADISGTVLLHCIYGLAREGLITEYYATGDAETLAQLSLKVRFDVPGIVFVPSAFGAELFLWAHGRSGLNANQITSAELDLPAEVDLHVPPGWCPVSDLEGRQTGNDSETDNGDAPDTPDED